MKIEIDKKTNILIVDDNPANLFSLSAALDGINVNIKTASSGNEALGLLLEHDFAVVILDVKMPGIDGFEVAGLMQNISKTKNIPIIFITATYKKGEFIIRGYRQGAVDYIYKPLHPEILKGKVRVFLELYQIRKRLEESEQIIREQNILLRKLSITDDLTQLFNRRHFNEMLNREFELIKRATLGSDLSILMIDLDNFKQINDNHGHDFGDYVLKSFAGLLRESVRETDITARYGGEEFIILCPHTDLEGSKVLAEKIRKKVEENEFKSEGHSRKINISIGVASYQTHNPSTASEMVTFADRALYRAKADGRNLVRIYNEK